MLGLVPHVGPSCIMVAVDLHWSSFEVEKLAPQTLVHSWRALVLPCQPRTKLIKKPVMGWGLYLVCLPVFNIYESPQLQFSISFEVYLLDDCTTCVCPTTQWLQIIDFHVLQKDLGWLPCSRIIIGHHHCCIGLRLIWNLSEIFDAHFTEAH